MKTLRSLAALSALLALLLAASAAAGNAPGHDAAADRVDAQLKRALESVREGRLDAALGEVDQLIARHPNFRLAHLVRGDLLLARAQPIARFGNTGHAGGERIDELRAEALARLRAIDFHPPEGVRRRVVADLGERRLLAARRREYRGAEDERQPALPVAHGLDLPVTGTIILRPSERGLIEHERS